MTDFKAKMRQIQFRSGLRPRPRWWTGERYRRTGERRRGEGRGGDPKSWFTTTMSEIMKTTYCITVWCDWWGRQCKSLPRAANTLAPPLYLSIIYHKLINYNVFAKCYAVFVGFRHAANFNTIDRLVLYFSTKRWLPYNIAQCAQRPGFPTITPVAWLCITYLFNSSLLESLSSTKQAAICSFASYFCLCLLAVDMDEYPIRAPGLSRISAVGKKWLLSDCTHAANSSRFRQ